MAQLGVAFTVREKFGWALAALQRIYRVAEQDFTLYFVDCGYPKPILTEIERFLADKSNVVRIDSPRFVWPSEALNLALPRLQDDHLCIIQNDVLIERGYFRELLSTVSTHGCDMVQPDTSEMQAGEYRPHRHEYTDTRIVRKDDKWWVQVPILNLPAEKPPERRIQHFELHTLLMTRRAAERVWPFPVLNTREHLDLAMRAFTENLVVYVNDRAKASYVLPPIQTCDQDYFDFRWNIAAAEQAHTTVQQRWGLGNMPNSMRFIAGHRAFLLPENVRQQEPTCELDVYWKE